MDININKIPQNHENTDTRFLKEGVNLIIRTNLSSDVKGTEDLKNIFHEAIEIKYFYEGESAIIVGKESIIAQPGDVVVINPYEFHTKVQMDGKEGKYHLIMVSLAYFETRNEPEIDLRQILIARGQQFRHHIQGDKRIGELILKLVEEYKNKEKYHISVMYGILLEVFSLLLRNEMNGDRDDLILDDRIKYYNLIEPAIKKIRNEYKNKLSIEELAEMCNVSKCHFCRIFKLVTQRTVVEYITDYRFQIADLLLAHSDKTILEISQECGFEDPSYFCRCYRKVYGISPNKRRHSVLQQKSKIVP